MIINALKLKYEADMRAAAANIEIYRKKSICRSLY